jgi:replicative DNA helicase
VDATDDGVLGVKTTDPEVALLSVVLNLGVGVQAVALKHGLRPDHFDQPLHGKIWAAALAITDRPSSSGETDLATIAAELGWDSTAGSRDGASHAGLLHRLQAADGLPSAMHDYAARIIERSKARHAALTADKIKAAAADIDLGEVAALADQVLPVEDVPEQQSMDELKAELRTHAKDGRSTELPWGNMPVLNGLLDGFWPGNLTIVGGHEAHGKSIFVDQVGEHLTLHYASTMCIYATEMTAFERAQRTISRYTPLEYDVVRRGRLTGAQMRAFEHGLSKIRWRFEIVGARSAGDIARDIRRRQWTIAIVDLLNFMPGLPGDTRPRREQLEDNARIFASCAQETGTHIIAVNHLNRNRLGQSDYPPEPTLDDLRETKVLQQAATNVLFVYRKAKLDDHGAPTRHPGEEAYVEVAKAKNGRTGLQPLKFEGKHQRFLLPDSPGVVGGMAA